MFVEGMNKSNLPGASETKHLSSEPEDDEILQLKKALLVDCMPEEDSSAQTFENITPLPIDPRTFIQAQVPAPQHLASTPLPHFNPFPFANVAVNPQPYTDYPLPINAFPVKFNNGMPSRFQPHPQLPTGPTNIVRPQGSFNYLPQNARFSGAQQQQMALQTPVQNRQFQNSIQSLGSLPPYSINNNMIAPRPMGFHAVAASETDFRATTTSKPAGPADSVGDAASENSTRKKGPKPKQQATVGSPATLEENAPNESIVFQDKTFSVGDFIILKDATVDSSDVSGRIVVQVNKFFPS